MINNTVSVTELRNNAKKVIEMAIDEPVVILQRSKPKVVLADAEYFRALEEAVLDDADRLEIEKAGKEEKDARPLSEYVKQRWG